MFTNGPSSPGYMDLDKGVELRRALLFSSFLSLSHRQFLTIIYSACFIGRFDLSVYTNLFRYDFLLKKKKNSIFILKNSLVWKSSSLLHDLVGLFSPWIAKKNYLSQKNHTFRLFSNQFHLYKRIHVLIVATFVAIAEDLWKSVVVKMANLPHRSDSVVFQRFLFSLNTHIFRKCLSDKRTSFKKS